jgi:hypothetical protein
MLLPTGKKLGTDNAKMLAYSDRIRLVRRAKELM